MNYKIPFFACIMLPFLSYGLANLNDKEINFMGLGDLEHDIIRFDGEIYERYFMLGNESLHKGNVTDAIEHYIKAISINSNSPQMYFNLGIAYETMEEFDKAVDSYTQAIRIKYDYPKAHAQLAKLLEKKGRTDDAITHYKIAFDQNSKLPDLNITIARLMSGREDFQGSLPYYKHAADADPNDIVRAFEYANTLNTCNYTEEALVLYRKILEKRPTDSGILYNIAYTLKKLGRIEESMPFYAEALKRNPNHAEAHFSLGLAYLTKGDFKEGWKEYEWRWQRNSQLTPRSFKQPLWDGSSLEGKTMFIHCEQGLGDTFQFIRLVQIVKQKYGGRIVVAVQKPLETVIAKCCPYIDMTITLDKIPVKFDYHCPLLSLPLILNIEQQTVPKNIPYIIPDPTLTEFWRRKLSSDANFKVGICWQGNSQYSTPFLRAVVAAKSMKLKQFAPLGAVRGVTFYSLQKQTGEDQLKDMPGNFKIKTFDGDFDDSHGRFMDTAAVIKNLDLVITIDTSISHFAAAIGIPVWILVPEPPDWRWMLDRTDTPWYPNMVLFRQQTVGDWDGVIHTIVQQLQKVVDKKTPILNFTVPKQTETTSAVSPSTAPSLSASKQSNGLYQELDSVERQLKTATQSLKTMNDDDVELTRTMRKCYLLSQLRDDLKDKIAALEGRA